jgi:hypothetical protein
MDLRVVQPDLSDLKALYQASMALIRPDHIVAWRGEDGASLAPLLPLARDRAGCGPGNGGGLFALAVSADRRALSPERLVARFPLSLAWLHQRTFISSAPDLVFGGCYSSQIHKKQLGIVERYGKV